MKADLHLHTYYSDGVESPAFVVERAAAAGLNLIAITDHDTLGGWQKAKVAAGHLNVTVVPAAEFTASLHGQEVHLLGYFPSFPGREVLDHLEQVQAFRRQRMETAVARLRERGVSISFDELPRHSSCQSLTGAHLARLLLEKGFARSLRGVWRRQAVRQSLESFTVTAEEVIEVIHKGAGLAVWAHPPVRRFPRRLEELAALGLDGVEVSNFRRGLDSMRRMQAEAEKFGLVATGGSDWHEGPGFGEEFVDEDLLEKFLHGLGLEKDCSEDKERR